MAELSRLADAGAAGGPAGAADAIRGTVASPGIAIGRLRLDRPVTVEAGPVGSETEERARLASALETAKGQLAALMGSAPDEMAGEILGFQLALLEDPELTAPGAPALAAGRGAAGAWRDGIGSLIADYEAADDAYFRARAGDLRDLELRVLRCLAEAAGAGDAPDPAAWEEPEILLTDELTPSRFLELDLGRVRGIASRIGSPTSHVAMLARARSVPLLVDLALEPAALEAERTPGPAILDAECGRLIPAPSGADLETARAAIEVAESERTAAGALADKPAATADGTPVKVLLNVDDPRSLETLDPDLCDGIGLTRTEFLFTAGAANEETQFKAYRALVVWAHGRPVTVRTLDAGGDKPVPGVTPEGESNPFLGLRGLRLSLARPELLRTQFRALLRAAAYGPVKAMLPMVTRPDEIEAARDILAEVEHELAKAEVAHGQVELGIMVETPACALEAEAFAANFYSIGTNDLIQYVMASARDTASVAYLHDPLARPVLRLIEDVAAAGAARGVEVSVCGEAASLPEVIPALLDRGIRVLSVPPGAVGRTKAAVAAHRLAGRDV